MEAQNTTTTVRTLSADEAVFPVTKERFRFTSPADDPREFGFDFFVEPGGEVAVTHCHPHQSETMRGRAGVLTVTIDGEDHALGAGDEMVIPAGAFHGFRNDGEVEAACEVVYDPAGRNRQWFQLISAYEAHRNREPSLLDLAPFIGAVGVYIEGPPIALQRYLVFPVAKLLAIVTGRRRRMFRYAAAVYGEAFAW